MVRGFVSIVVDVHFVAVAAVVVLIVVLLFFSLLLWCLVVVVVWCLLVVRCLLVVWCLLVVVWVCCSLLFVGCWLFIVDFFLVVVVAAAAVVLVVVVVVVVLVVVMVVMVVGGQHAALEAKPRHGNPRLFGSWSRCLFGLFTAPSSRAWPVEGKVSVQLGRWSEHGLGSPGWVWEVLWHSWSNDCNDLI